MEVCTAELPSPGSTYRLQLNAGMTLDDASELVDYLYEIGIDTCYVSPILKSRPGSGHGYDIVDHSQINPEIGGMAALERFVTSLRQFAMGLVVDIVPNHMCVSDLSNARWCDVLENGPSSPQAQFFDIDWHPPRENLAHKVLLPRLGDQYGRVLENQEIQVEYATGSFVARYYETAFPLAPRSWPLILAPALEQIKQTLGGSHRSVLELESIITALGYLPLRTEVNQDRIRERQREKEIIKRRLAAISAESEVVRTAIAESLRNINGRKGNPGSFDKLEELLSGQAYRLSFWRVAADEINYRRFFDVNELAAIRTEDPLVFEKTHALIFDLVQTGAITGLRVDHPDGLFDPARYFGDLREQTGKDLYVVAEKIVTNGEELRENWQVAGTTGYDFLNLLNGLFVYPGSRRTFRNFYERWIGRKISFDDLVYESKRLILRASMSSELHVLARQLDRICQYHRHSRDFTLETLRFALSEIIACFPVYRTYSTDRQSQPDAEDRRHIAKAVRLAKSRNAATSESVFDAIACLLLLEDPEGTTEAQRSERRSFVMRFQQLTGPVMAKGVEDTAFYRYYPLASINEVGGDLSRFGVSSRVFHRKNEIRLRRWPGAMLASSTHDTKRSEDVRARLNVLSEIPMDWYAAVRRWSGLNAGHRADVAGMVVPDRNAEYLLYQTLVGTWPMVKPTAKEHAQFIRRIQAYMDKALKEAKVFTSWIDPDDQYDRAVRDFVAAILVDSGRNAFLEDFVAFMRPIARAGMYNSLSQVLLKIASPGVPDFYQGCESWNFSLVDPDNRRPVDYPRLRDDLCAIRKQGELSKLLPELLSHPENGRIKLDVTRAALSYRRANRELFLSGSYWPLQTVGSRRHHVVAFAREFEGRTVIALAARFFLKLGISADRALTPELWGDTVLRLSNGMEGSCFRDVLTDRRLQSLRSANKAAIPISEVFSAGLPVALLEARPEA